jgi:hypothetical protein
MLDEFTVIYGSAAERRVWNGREKVQEADLRIKHGEYLGMSIANCTTFCSGRSILAAVDHAD